MTTTVEKTITVHRPVNTVYNQWTQFEDFPHFMGGVSSVSQLAADRVHWVAEIAGIRREWDATILEQVPDSKIAWAATDGATNAGSVYFRSVGRDQTEVRLVLEYAPEGLVEKVGDAVSLINRQAESDLEKFKSFIESQDYPTGAWRGQVNPGASRPTPSVEDASSSKGDDGKAGISVKAVAAGAAGVAVGAAAAAGAIKHGSDGGVPEEVRTDGRDVVDILTADHLEVTALLNELSGTSDPEAGRELADTVIAELVRHSVAEEMYVYPEMRKHLPDGDAAVNHDVEEHKKIEKTLKELEKADTAEPHFAALVAGLFAMLRDHVADEEQNQFPQLRARIPRETLIDIGAKVEAAKKAAPTRPHPAAPNSAPFHKLVGPGVGLVDRLRDKISGRTTA